MKEAHKRMKAAGVTLLIGAVLTLMVAVNGLTAVFLQGATFGALGPLGACLLLAKLFCLPAAPALAAAGGKLLGEAHVLGISKE